MNFDQDPYIVLFVFDSLHYMGGAEKHLIQLLDCLDGSEFRPILFCLSGGQLLDDFKKKDYDVYDMNVRRVYGLGGINTLISLVKVIKFHKVNLISTYYESSDFLGLIASKITKIPVVSNRRDMGFKLKKSHIIFYQLFSKQFVKIISVSNAVKKATSVRENIPLDNIETIHNVIDVSLYTNDSYDTNKIRKKWGINDNDKVVGIIAGLRKVKGHECFIKAACRVVKEIPGVKFLIVGKDYLETGCSKRDLMNLARKLGVADKLIFTGEQKNIFEILSVIDIVVNSSLSEGMSNTILEAMAAGKLVIASDVGGNPEVVKDCETGYLFRSKDFLALSKLIINSLNDPHKMKIMGQRSQIYIKDHHDISMLCKKYCDVYMKCVVN